jgi:lysozyme
MARLIEHDPNFLDQLKRHEGYRSEAYICPAGKLTIGWGHNVEAKPVPGVEQVGDGISKEKAMALLEDDVYAVTRKLDRLIPWWRELSNPRQAVLANMAFQMGVTGLMGFAKALHHVEAGEWREAGVEMLRSRWATQTRTRAAELSTQMLLGVWQED